MIWLIEEVCKLISQYVLGKPENEVCRTMIPPIIGGSHSKDKLMRFHRLNSPMWDSILS